MKSKTHSFPGPVLSVSDNHDNKFKRKKVEDFTDETGFAWFWSYMPGISLEDSPCPFLHNFSKEAHCLLLAPLEMNGTLCCPNGN